MSVVDYFLLAFNYLYFRIMRKVNKTMEEVTIEEVASQYRHSSIEETIQVYKDLWILDDNYD